MAYKKQEMIDQAIDAIQENELIFIEEIFAFVPYSKATFYAKKLDESDTIKKALNDVKISTKSHLRKTWRKSDNPSLQIALYKLIGTDEETEKLNGSKQKHEHSGKVDNTHSIRLEFAQSPVPIDVTDELSIEDQEHLKKLESKK